MSHGRINAHPSDTSGSPVDIDTQPNLPPALWCTARSADITGRREVAGCSLAGISDLTLDTEARWVRAGRGRSRRRGRREHRRGWQRSGSVGGVEGGGSIPTSCFTVSMSFSRDISRARSEAMVSSWLATVLVRLPTTAMMELKLDPGIETISSATRMPDSRS